jgi:hypothetical protein
VTGTPTLREALLHFRRANGLGADEAARASWTCRLGPLTVRLPNFAWRRRAIEAHDLHHVLTGTPCTMRGEFEMAAWEFGAGGMPHWAAAAFCLPLVLAGAVAAPRPTWRAFIAGRRSRSLHEAPAEQRLLDAPLPIAREMIGLATADATTADRLHFAWLIAKGTLVCLLPPGLLALVMATIAL